MIANEKHDNSKKEHHTIEINRYRYACIQPHIF